MERAFGMQTDQLPHELGKDMRPKKRRRVGNNRHRGSEHSTHGQMVMEDTQRPGRTVGTGAPTATQHHKLGRTRGAGFLFSKGPGTI